MFSQSMIALVISDMAPYICIVILYLTLHYLTLHLTLYLTLILQRGLRVRRQPDIVQELQPVGEERLQSVVDVDGTVLDGLEVPDDAVDVSLDREDLFGGEAHQRTEDVEHLAQT